MVVQMNRFGLGKIKIHHHLVLAGVVRAAFVAFGEWQDRNFRVKYTDVDYNVFVDGARHVSQGRSPYLRETYRYSPLLAVLLVPGVLLHPVYGKVLFAAADVLVGRYVHRIVRAAKFGERKATFCAALWLYNPVTLTVSTRGNADSLVSLLVVFVAHGVLKGRDAAAALAYGFSVHVKMYTVVYALPLYLCLQQKQAPGAQKQESEPSSVVLPNRRRALFFASAALGFCVPTLVCYVAYGTDFLRETFFYHLVRKDVRHNFSPLFYPLYLGGETGPFGASLLFVPQLLLVAAISAKYGRPGDLPFALFCVTFVLVTFNKVCTSQYFLWYLCLLPAALPKLGLTLRNGLLLLSMWVGGQALWLAQAYYLEFQGKPLFLNVWVAGLIFLVANTFILCYTMFHYSTYSRRTKKPKQK